MIKKLIFTGIILFGSFISNAQLALLGKIWTNGSESECNWYFEDSRVCFQMIYTNDTMKVDSRMIMQAGSKDLQIITYQNGKRTEALIPDDQRVKDSLSVSFFKEGATAYFPNFGNCPKVRARTTTHEYMAYLIQDLPIDLRRYEHMFSNNELFMWLLKENPHAFPAQYIKVDVKGELLLSLLMEKSMEEISPSIWE